MLDGPHNGLYYQDFLSRLSRERNTQIYLEVGVQSGVNLSQISCNHAIGVDPSFKISADVTANKNSVALYKTTSDLFFEKNASEIVMRGGLDMAFLDGMHLFEFLLRDFMNTEKISKKNALITLHDCLPFDGEMIERINDPDNRTPGPFPGAWTGDVWKIINILKAYRRDLKVILVDCHPTGLVCITNLDPKSTVLDEKYLEIVEDFRSRPNDLEAIKSFYKNNPLTAAEDIIENDRHSLYFRA